MRSTIILLALLTSVAQAQENVFRNGPADQRTSSFFRVASVSGGVSQEWGDQVKLAGSGRTITEMTVYTFGDFGAPSGSEKIRIRFYDQTGGITGNPPKPGPGNLLWDSGFIPMKPGWRAQRIAVPSIVVPEVFTWSASFDGVTGLPFNRSGLCYFGPPTIGESGNWLWRRTNDTSPWNYQVTDWSNGTTAYGSLGVSFWAGGSPGPTIFDSTLSAYRQFNLTPEEELGDDVVFEGEGRHVATASVEYVSDIANVQGDEKARIRVYTRIDNDPYGTPGDLLYDSGFQPIDASVGEHLATVYPELLLPDDIIWTIEFSGTSQQAGDSLSLPAKTDPSIGASVPTFWVSKTSSFVPFWFGDPTYDPTSWPNTTFGYNSIVANFSAKFQADVPPTIIEHSPPAVLNPGVSFTGGDGSLAASDDVRWHLRPGVVFSTALPPIVLTFSYTLPQPTASSLRFVFESRATASTIRQEIQAWDFVVGAWETVDLVSSIAVGAQPDLVRTVPLADLPSLIGPANEVRLRTRWRLTGPVVAYPWNVGVDRVYLAFRP